MHPYSYLYYGGSAVFVCQGADMAVDIPYRWLEFFLEDDEELEVRSLWLTCVRVPRFSRVHTYGGSKIRAPTATCLWCWHSSGPRYYLNQITTRIMHLKYYRLDPLLRLVDIYSGSASSIRVGAC